MFWGRVVVCVGVQYQMWQVGKTRTVVFLLWESLFILRTLSRLITRHFRENRFIMRKVIVIVFLFLLASAPTSSQMIRGGNCGISIPIKMRKMLGKGDNPLDMGCTLIKDRKSFQEDYQSKVLLSKLCT